MVRKLTWRTLTVVAINFLYYTTAKGITGRGDNSRGLTGDQTMVEKAVGRAPSFTDSLVERLNRRREIRAQGALEFALILGALLLVAGLLVVMISLSAQGISSDVNGQIDNVRENVVMPGLVGLVTVLTFKRL